MVVGQVVVAVAQNSGTLHECEIEASRTKIEASKTKFEATAMTDVLVHALYPSLCILNIPMFMALMWEPATSVYSMHVCTLQTHLL